MARSGGGPSGSTRGGGSHMAEAERLNREVEERVRSVIRYELGA